jgi:Fur family ferric uptake transcriptional regulator
VKTPRAARATQPTRPPDTLQRRALRAAFERADRPLSPGEVLRAARRGAPRLGLATVYRNLRLLLAEGWLVEVALPGAPNRYEIAGKHHHHHFRCRSCDRVFEVDGCPPDLRALLPRGFRLESHDITLVGRCPDCARRAPRAS